MNSGIRSPAAWLRCAVWAVVYLVALAALSGCTAQPGVCDHVLVVPYEVGERPVCVLVRREEP